MALDIVNGAAADHDFLIERFSFLYDRRIAALVVRDAVSKVKKDRNGIAHMVLPWIDALGLFTPDRSTEMGGEPFLPDMPPHVDPHLLTSLKVQVTRMGSEVARFASGFPAHILDETNELPGSNYAPLLELGIIPDEVMLGQGDAVCFLGSTTLHEFITVGSRKSYINSYQLNDAAL